MSGDDVEAIDKRPRDGQRSLLVNGLRVDVTADHRLMDDVLVPRLEQLAADAGGDVRTFVFLAAPPATGKSVLATLLVERARHLDVDAVGLDGFHLPQARLLSTFVDGPVGPRPLADVKGAPETFDTDGLARHLEASLTRDVSWPVYDRALHDVVPAAHPLTAGLVVLEGNWLLLDDPRWSPLTRYSSFNVFIDADPRQLRERLVDRKVRGGLSRAEAEAFYERSDRLNVQRVLEQSDRRKVDLLLHLSPDGSIQQGDIHE